MLISYKPCESSDMNFWNSHVTWFVHLIKGSCLVAFYTKLTPCLVWCWSFFCKWRYLFYLPSDPTRTLRWDVMHIHGCIYGWELLTACHHISYKNVLPLKNWVGWNITRQEKNATTSKIYILRRSSQKLKKHIFPIITTIYNFTVKISTTWTKNVVKSILETWNVNYVILYVCFNCFWKKIWNVKKNSFKYTKFTIKS